MENNNLKKSLGIILILFLLALTISTALDIRIKIRETENKISVSATGEVYAKPDLALVALTVINEAKTVAEALSENTEKMNGVITFVKEQGIEEKDIKTTSFNIYPRYEWHKDTEIYPEGKRVLVGYEVSQNLQLKIRDMTKIGEIIEGATGAGANQVGDLELTIDNQEELKKQAREEAIEKAKTKARELASQLDVRLVRISNFAESSVIPSFYTLERAEVLGVEEEAPVPQIETGENKIEVTVSITYEIE
jgi:uncharacterized protein YggE